MKMFGIKSAVMALVLGAAVFGYAQDQPKPEDKPPTQEKEAKPAHPPKAVKPASGAHQSQPAAKRTQDQAKQQPKDQQKPTRQQAKQTQAKPAPENAKRAPADNSKRSEDNSRVAQAVQPGVAQSSRPAANSGQHGRIPDKQFRAHFGQAHHFRIGHPVTVDNRPRFQYGGYWFEFADAWPAGWSYDDDCYIDYVDGGYFLFDPLHPGIRIAVLIVS